MAQSAKVRLIELYKQQSEQIHMALIAKCLTGDVPAIKLLLEHIHGSPTKQEEIEDKSAIPLVINDDQYRQLITAAFKRNADDDGTGTAGTPSDQGVAGGVS